METAAQPVGETLHQQISIELAASLARVSLATMRRAMDRGELVPHRRNRVELDRAAVIAWAERRRQQREAAAEAAQQRAAAGE